MDEIDCSVAILKPRQPMLDWLLNLPDWAQDRMTLKELRDDCTVLLIPAAEDDVGHLRFIQAHCDHIFETELLLWGIDNSLWPPKRDFKTFTTWFDIELHSLVLDMSAEVGDEADDGRVH